MERMMAESNFKDVESPAVEETVDKTWKDWVKNKFEIARLIVRGQHEQAAELAEENKWIKESLDLKDGVDQPATLKDKSPFHITYNPGERDN